MKAFLHLSDLNMQRLLSALVLGLCNFGLMSYSLAVTFVSPIEEVSWEIEGSPFVCHLRQNIPGFGMALFEHEAGESIVFRLQPIQKQQLPSRVRLDVGASPWAPGGDTRFLAELAFEAGEVRVPATQTSNMLAALHTGKMPIFSARGWYNSPHAVSVGVISVNFKQAYSDYLECITGLLPVNYRQIARTALLFPTGEHQLSDATRARLDLIIEYVLTDNSVAQIFVDGHTDNDGRRLVLRDLSQRRAEEVTQYLVTRGVPEEQIVTRFHGDRYPVVDNDSPENRQRNRRVTVRLERE